MSKFVRFVAGFAFVSMSVASRAESGLEAVSREVRAIFENSQGASQVENGVLVKGRVSQGNGADCDLVFSAKQGALILNASNFLDNHGRLHPGIYGSFDFLNVSRVSKNSPDRLVLLANYDDRDTKITIQKNAAGGISGFSIREKKPLLESIDTGFVRSFAVDCEF